MVARINTSSNLNKVLRYNEQKLHEKQAEILLAENFLKDANQLSFSDKMCWFQKFISLNEQTKTNTLHVSLNFDPSDRLHNEKLTEIAKAYMERIGFADQPYLVYRHYDAAHPHIHIVSVNIRSDGSRISLHNLGRNQSEKARKEIETIFQLIKAQKKEPDESFKMIPVSAQKIIMGKSSVKRAISNVLGLVINQYKYASLHELNAILQLYNVRADGGEKGSRMNEAGGLVYCVIDEKGNRISPPIKASAFYMRPTLKNLKQKFEENEKIKPSFAKRIRITIDYTFFKKPVLQLQQFIDELRKEKISVVLRQNKDGLVYGITYVDHHMKSVFNGSDLGKGYSAAMVLKRTNFNQTKPDDSSVTDGKKRNQKPQDSANDISLEPIHAHQTVLEVLITPEQDFSYVPYPLKKRKRKRKNQRL